MKYTLMTVLALMSANSFALDPEIMEREAQRSTLFHPTCKIFYAPLEDKAANREIEQILESKGYEALNSKKEIKEFKGGLGYLFSGDEGRAKRRQEHSIKNCEKLQDSLSLNFEAGWRSEETGFTSVEISRLEKTDCEKRNLDEELTHEVVRNLPTEFPKPVPGFNETYRDVLAKQIGDVINKTMAELPKCQKQEDHNFEVTETAPLAPPPECEAGPGCYDGQRYSNIKELNEIENRRIQRLTGGTAQ